MCLIVFRFDPELEESLLLIGNRDEFHARPTANLHHWDAPSGIAGGRDLQAGGTWLAAHVSGRFATITNSRDGAPIDTNRRSRGLLIRDFLQSDASSLDYLAAIRGADYAGFNLIVFDGKTLAYGSNRDASGPRRLDPGVYAVSNATIDTPWHKLEQTKTKFIELLGNEETGDESLLSILRDETLAPRAEVDDSILPFERAHRVTAAFVNDATYGTRCSSIVRWGRKQGYRLSERRFGPNGRAIGETHIQLPLVWSE